MKICSEPSSYRDRRAHIVYRDDEVVRIILPSGVDDYLRTSDVRAILVRRGLLQPCAETRTDGFEAFDARFALHHPRLSQVTYPYEWSFSMLQDAALLHLDLHCLALDNGATLSDGSAYNVQFDKGRPVFIDCTSLIPYEEGAYWAGYDQFCEQFLNPLLLGSQGHIPFQGWYRGAPEGLPSDWISRCVPLRARLSPAIFFHLVLNGYARRHPRAGSGPRRALPLSGLRWLLHSLRRLIAGLRAPAPDIPSIVDYGSNSPHSADYLAAKQEAVAAFTRELAPRCLVDVGSNTGTYSFVALRNGASSAVCLEADSTAVDEIYRRARQQQAALLPLVIDFANASPAQGWRGAERRRIEERIVGDGLLALAVIHHLCLTRRLPIAQVVRELVWLAPDGLIEFVPIDDPFATALAGPRAQDYPEYSNENFRAELERHAQIISVKPLPGSARSLYRYHRR